MPASGCSPQGSRPIPTSASSAAEIERDPENKNTLTNPVVLVEVLSDSTEGYDREEKFSHYRRIPSLREYLLVSQHERRDRALLAQRRRELDAP